MEAENEQGAVLSFAPETVVALHEVACDGQEPPEAVIEKIIRENLPAAGASGEFEAGRVKEMVRALGFVPMKVYRQRISLCRNCEQGKYVLQGGGEAFLQCAKCNCLMSVKARLSFAACPLGLF